MPVNSHADVATDDRTDPVFLLGAARSGTSLLYKTLCLHPRAAWISNWVGRFPGLPQLAVLNRLAYVWPRRQIDTWFGPSASNAYVYSARRSIAQRLFPMPVEGEPVFRRCGIEEHPGATTGADPSRLGAAFSTVRRFGGGDRVVCKRIANNRRVELLDRAFPRARFVEIVRDGRAVAFSLSRVDWWPDSYVWWYGGTPRDWAGEGLDPWEICARNWVEELAAIRAGMHSVAPDRLLQIRYESFVAAPQDTLVEVAAFAGFRPEPRWLDRLASVRFPDRNERWRSQLDRGVIEQIESVQKDALARYGYR